MKNHWIRKIAIVGAIALTSTLAFGQKIDEKSKQILDNITQKYNANKNNYFKFTFGSGTQKKVSKIEHGIYYSAGDKYKLKIMGTEQIYDGQKIYNISEEDMEINIAKPNTNQAMFSPINYLTSYRKDFNVQYSGEITIEGRKVSLIKLTPVKTNGLEFVNLYIDSKKNELLKLEQYGTNKDIAVISIKEHKANQNISPSMFHFDKAKYKQYIITEL